MKMVINNELINLNVDILAKAGLKKPTINKLHKLKVKAVGDIAKVEDAELKAILEAGEEMSIEQLAALLELKLVDFTTKVFACLKEDPCYEIVMLHVNNHTHQEIAQKYNTSKEKVKLNISKFLKNLFTLVDALGTSLIANKPYLGIEELEELFAEEDDYKLLLAAFKAHDTKWLYHFEAECFTAIVQKAR